MVSICYHMIANHGDGYASTSRSGRSPGRGRSLKATRFRTRPQRRSRAPHHPRRSLASRTCRILGARRGASCCYPRQDHGAIGGSDPAGSRRAVKIVVDASIALKWVFDEPGSAAATALRGEELLAPTLWLAEAANAVWRRARLGDITADEAVAHFSELANAPVVLVVMEPHLERALALAMEIGHPIYDCVYLALALHHETHVVTADRRFAAAASTVGLVDRVRLLAP
jgi:predicted nucleic acid-binding protein